MGDRNRGLAASREEVKRLAGQRVSEVTPSRRDFAQYVSTQKQALAVIARLSSGAVAAVVEQARACDDAEVAALAVAANERSLNDMAAIAAATTAPILRDALIIDPSQLYATRLHGGDAAVFPAADLDAAALHELVALAGSLHMASIIEVLAAADLATALRLPHVLVGLRCTRADGRVDMERTLQLAAQVPGQHTVIVLPEVHSPVECAALRGACDAVMVGAALRDAADIAATLRELTGG